MTAFDAVSTILMLCALVYAVRSLAGGFGEPLSDRHAFRQTQTAISAFSIAHGGRWFAYETPVLGPPYSIPFELPIFQWIVAAIHRATGFALDQVGRSVSIAFFFAALGPFYRLERSFGLSPGASRLGVGLVLTSPMYLYWSRCFLIESTALFFSVLALDLGVRSLRRFDEPRRAFGLGVASCCAMLVKPTTGFAFLFPLGLLFVHRLATDAHRRTRLWAYARTALVAFVLPTILLALWTRYADGLKRQNPLAATFITEEALRAWNYGTLDQKLAPVTWTLFWERTTVGTFGYEFGPIAAATLAIVTVRPFLRVAAIVAGILGTFAVFTNLHAVHDYYQYSTDLLAILVVALGLGHAERLAPTRRWAIALLATAIGIGSCVTYERGYAIPQNHPSHALPDVGRFTRDHTRPNEIIVVYGEDWSPVVPYYAERRAIGNRWNYEARDAPLRASLGLARARGERLGAVVSCHAQAAHGERRSRDLFAGPPRCSPVGPCLVCTR